MLIQDDYNFIDINEILDMFPEQLLYDCNDPDLINKFVVVVKLKNGNIQYLNQVFNTSIEASVWISEIIDLQQFELFLKNYSF